MPQTLFRITRAIKHFKSGNSEFRLDVYPKLETCYNKLVDISEETAATLDYLDMEIPTLLTQFCQKLGDTKATYERLADAFEIPSNIERARIPLVDWIEHHFHEVVEIPTGEITVIMGGNGCGKSTMMNLMALMDQSNQGTEITLNFSEKHYHYQDMPTKGLSSPEQVFLRQNAFSFMFQDDYLIQTFDNQKNLELSNLLKGRKTTEGGIVLDFVLEQFILLDESYLTKYPSQVSGGQRQRFSLGRAVLANSPIIFADEPTAALDTYSSNIILQRLRDWCQAVPEERCVVLICHDIDLAYKYGDNFWLLSPTEWANKEGKEGESRLQGRHHSFMRKADNHPNLKEWIQHAISLTKRQQAGIELQPKQREQLAQVGASTQKIEEPPTSFCARYAKNDVFPNRNLNIPNQAIMQIISFTLFFTISFLLIGFLKGSEQAQLKELEESSFLRLKVAPNDKYPVFREESLGLLNAVQRKGSEFILPIQKGLEEKEFKATNLVNVKGQNEIHLQFVTTHKRTVKGVGNTANLEDPMFLILNRQQHLQKWFEPPNVSKRHQMILKNSFLSGKLGYVLPETFPNTLSRFKKLKLNQQKTEFVEINLLKIVNKLIQTAKDSNRDSELKALASYRKIEQADTYKFATNLSKVLSDSTQYFDALAFLEDPVFQKLLTELVVQDPKQLDLRIQRYGFQVDVLARVDELPDNKDFIVLEELFLDYNRQTLIKPQRYGQLTLTYPMDQWSEKKLETLAGHFRCETYLHPNCSPDLQSGRFRFADIQENQDEVTLVFSKAQPEAPLIHKDDWKPVLTWLKTNLGNFDEATQLNWEEPELIDLEPQPYEAGEYQQLVIYVNKLEDVIPIVNLLKQPDLNYNVVGDVISEIRNLQKMTNLFSIVTAIIIGSLVLLASFNFWVSCRIHIERKYSDIGLLLSFGGSKSSIMKIFLIETSISFFSALGASILCTGALSAVILILVEQTSLDVSFTYWTLVFFLPVLLGMASMYVPTISLVKKAVEKSPSMLLKM
ncbi:ATP-binding cassette domain-containing protein [Deltaproteobacteria bacterium TL4]